MVRHQGQSVLALGVSMTKGGDIIELGHALQKEVAAIRADLPVGIEMTQIQDQPKAVARSVNEFVEDDATTLAAKRALVSGDRMLLERRARALADASDLPISAFDRGLAVWGTPGEHVDLTAEPHPGIAAALGIDR